MCTQPFKRWLEVWWCLRCFHSTEAPILFQPHRKHSPFDYQPTKWEWITLHWPNLRTCVPIITSARRVRHRLWDYQMCYVKLHQKCITSQRLKSPDIIQSSNIDILRSSPSILHAHYTVQTMDCYSELRGQLGTNMVEQLPQNNLDATSSAWEFQFQASDLAVTIEADKRDRWEQRNHVQNACSPCWDKPAVYHVFFM